LFEHALLTDDGLADLAGDPAVAAIEPLDGRQFAVDPRPAARLFERDGLRDRLGFGGLAVGRQPFAAAAQPATARGNLHHQTTVFALNGRHRQRVPVFRRLTNTHIYQLSGSRREATV